VDETIGAPRPGGGEGGGNEAAGVLGGAVADSRVVPNPTAHAAGTATAPPAAGSDPAAQDTAAQDTDARAAGARTLAAAARMRVLITVFFALDGFVFANWVVRVPEVKAHVGASPGALGLALLGVSGGAVATMTVTGRLCARFGSRPVTLATCLLLAVSVTLPPLVSSVGALGGVLLVFGAAYGGMNVAINSAAVDVVRQLDRPLMPTFHAAYSLGGLVGALVGGAVAQALSPAAHLGLIGVFAFAAALVLGAALLRCPPLPVERREASLTGGRLRLRLRPPLGPGRRGPAGHPPSDTAAPGAALAHDRPDGRVRALVFMFGTIALCTAYGEGSLADWGALHLRTDLHTGVGMAAAGYASFSVAMFAGRLSGTWLLARLGRTAVLAAGGVTAAAGMLVAALSPALPLVLLGFVLVGLGLANQFPAAIGQAGELTGAPGVAAASTLGYGGMLAGPPVIGLLADHAGLPVALTSIAVLAAAAAVLALAARRAEAAWRPTV
jgi:MFS family permease